MNVSYLTEQSIKRERQMFSCFSNGDCGAAARGATVSDRISNFFVKAAYAGDGGVTSGASPDVGIRGQLFAMQRSHARLPFTPLPSDDDTNDIVTDGDGGISPRGEVRGVAPLSRRERCGIAERMLAAVHPAAQAAAAPVPAPEAEAEPAPQTRQLHFRLRRRLVAEDPVARMTGSEVVIGGTQQLRSVFYLEPEEDAEAQAREAEAQAREAERRRAAAHTTTVTRKFHLRPVEGDTIGLTAAQAGNRCLYNNNNSNSSGEGRKTYRRMRLVEFTEAEMAADRAAAAAAAEAEAAEGSGDSAEGAGSKSEGGEKKKATAHACAGTPLSRQVNDNCFARHSC